MAIKFKILHREACHVTSTSKIAFIHSQCEIYSCQLYLSQHTTKVTNTAWIIEDLNN